MRCAAVNCRENINGYCMCESYVTISSDGECEQFYPVVDDQKGETHE